MVKHVALCRHHVSTMYEVPANFLTLYPVTSHMCVSTVCRLPPIIRWIGQKPYDCTFMQFSTTQPQPIRNGLSVCDAHAQVEMSLNENLIGTEIDWFRIPQCVCQANEPRRQKLCQTSCHHPTLSIEMCSGGKRCYGN